MSSGRVALSVYSPIERTPGANAFVLALDRVLGPNASKIKRGEHSFNAPDELREPLIEAGFVKVEVQTVVQQIAFPSVLDYVRFQLLATPMAALLSNRDEADRQAVIIGDLKLCRSFNVGGRRVFLPPRSIRRNWARYRLITSAVGTFRKRRDRLPMSAVGG